MTIWDLHCHPAGFGGRTPEESSAEAIRIADLMGVEKLCIYLGSLNDTNPGPAEMRAHNDFILRCVQHFAHRFYGFAYVNPNYVDASLEEIKRCLRDGPFVGIKLWVARRCSDPAIDPIIRAAADLKAVIFQHTWFKTGNTNLPGESTPADLARLAARFPETPIICGHTGGNWELGIRAIRPHSNVSAGIAGSDPTNGFVEMAVRELGAHRVIYGSDSGGRSMSSQLAKLLGARISDADRELAASGNLRRLVDRALAAKR
ncbi:MAG: amidohydrolase family protein [Bryobacteraceae bacterium]